MSDTIAEPIAAEDAPVTEDVTDAVAADAAAADAAAADAATEDADYAIEVNDVSMIFNIASEQLNNLKEYFIKIMRHELFFKEFRALDHVSFKVGRGEVVGLVGTNGSGKSTMLKCIAGVLEPSEGSIVVRGNIAPLIELGAGFDLELTARENIYLNGALLGYTREFIDEHLQEIIDFAELEDFMDMPLKNYSSGMVARIAFAIATVTEPDVLIVDETLSVGDVFFQQKCEDRIRSFIDSGNVTVLFVSHSMSQVARICDRVIWIEKGVMRRDGPAKEVLGEYSAQFDPAAGQGGEKVVVERLVADAPDALLDADRTTGLIPERDEAGNANRFFVAHTGAPIAVPAVRYQVKRGNAYLYPVLDPSLYSVVYIRNEEGKIVREAVDEGTYTVEIDLADAARTRYQLVSTSFSFTVRDFGHYDDVDSAAWYSIAVERAYDLYFLDDTPDNRLRPDEPVSRADVVELMWRMSFGAPEPVGGPACSVSPERAFTDVSGGEPFAEALAWALRAGVVLAPEKPGPFRPDDPVTREAFACMLARLARSRGAYVAPSLDALASISDADAISGWALESVAWAVAGKVMGNGGTVSSGALVSRAEAASMAVNYQPQALDGHNRLTNPR